MYIKAPQGVIPPKLGQLCRLIKSIYGLKQESRQWFEKSTTFLHSQGFIHVPVDHTLLTKSIPTSFKTLLVYVDAIFLVGTSLNVFDDLKRALDNTFHIKCLGQLKFLFGLEVARSSKGITLCQRKCCSNLLNDSGLSGCKPPFTPLDASTCLHQDGSLNFTDVTVYIQYVGILIYLTTTRSNITFAIQ